MVWETAGLAVSALNGTGGSLASAAIDGARRKLTGGENATATAATTANGFELLLPRLDGCLIWKVASAASFGGALPKRVHSGSQALPYSNLHRPTALQQ
ncbi:hypothetical protein KC356_g106 [Hortaea werneckii]|nr:hypothetical protein KC356_g106 [Hortaea werneckii]